MGLLTHHLWEWRVTRPLVEVHGSFLQNLHLPSNPTTNRTHEHLSQRSENSPRKPTQKCLWEPCWYLTKTGHHLEVLWCVSGYANSGVSIPWTAPRQQKEPTVDTHDPLMYLQGLTLSGKSQSQKVAYCLIPLIRHS